MQNSSQDQRNIHSRSTDTQLCCLRSEFLAAEDEDPSPGLTESRKDGCRVPHQTSTDGQPCYVLHSCKRMTSSLCKFVTRRRGTVSTISETAPMTSGALRELTLIGLKVCCACMPMCPEEHVKNLANTDTCVSGNVTKTGAEGRPS